MTNDPLMEEFPGSNEEPASSRAEETSSARGDGLKTSGILGIWETLSQFGLGEVVFRVGTNLLSIALVLVVIWALRAFYLHLQITGSIDIPRGAALAAALPSPTPTKAPPGLPAFDNASQQTFSGIPRRIVLDTIIPNRPRTEVITYTVQTGDTIFGIAEKFGLQPETILWGNTYTLADDPHTLRPGQVLNILPVNGTYHRWSAGEGLNGVAKGYGVKPEDIINWPGNHLNPETLGNWSLPNIEPGAMLMVPGGKRAFVTWSAPRISRTNPGVAKIYGPGACGTIVDGAVGVGAFIWPTGIHWLSGFDYSPGTNHLGIDIAGSTGDAIFASDNGVIVYAGWNNYGYGYVLVIDHGNGWQTLYAHLSAYYVGCGQSVYQGDNVAAMGSTGNSTGSHLHFEMLHDTYGKVNPWNFLPAP